MSLSSNFPKNPSPFWDLDFFIQADRLGISSTRHCRVVSHHTIGVYKKCRLDDIQNCVLMICNSYGIDEIQGFALIYRRFYAIIHTGNDIMKNLKVIPKDKYRVIKISKDALFEFIYESMIQVSQSGGAFKIFSKKCFYLLTG